MHSESEIEHAGVVHRIEEKTITVKIIAHPGCASCHASGLCNESGSVDKYFTVPYQDGIAKGQDVKIVTTLSTGFRALFLGYILPLLLLLVSLIVMLAAGIGEFWTAIASIAAVAFYYFLIFKLRDRIAKNINFTLKPS
jgi:sigma-E factor negative regulatory protein RseC